MPAALDRLTALLTQNLRVTIADGRVFIGSFAGTDAPLNILLLNTDEFRLGPDENPDGRYVGQILIPWKLVVKAEVQTAPSALSLDAHQGLYIVILYIAVIAKNHAIQQKPPNPQSFRKVIHTFALCRLHDIGAIMQSFIGDSPSAIYAVQIPQFSPSTLPFARFIPFVCTALPISPFLPHRNT
ncbi:hypothetical protein DFH08DRAFT_953889 [Mycena albidolilacea]|uniref:LSM domain-containing protein n=1 Tax=Mycena albidolilacea TaxID=1033008 RepID=A0AAD7EY53_9AGAR|nr:hypothetical protein DFH08DRAFT_953889 [Mycena albidolilacea]